MDLQSIYLAGVNHKTCPVEIREQLAFGDDGCERFLGILQQSSHIKEAIIVSTCNRTELYVVSDETEEVTSEYLPAAMIHFARLPEAETEPHFYQAQGLEAVDHLCRVAAGLDSLVLGEDQIIGQLRKAYSRSVKRKLAGTVFHKLFHQVFRAGKRSRGETKINEGSASVGSVAVDLAKRILPDFSTKTVLMVGAGEMAVATLTNLQNVKSGRLIITNRTQSKAEELAAKFNAEILPFQELSEGLKQADLVVCSTGAKTPVIQAAAVNGIITQRPDRPLYMIDIAMPRNIDKAVNEIANVSLYDIDGLKKSVNQNMQQREAEIPKVESIIKEEIESFLEWFATFDALPTIKHLQKHFEEIRQKEIKRNRKFFGQENLDQMEKFSRSLLNKLLHSPMMCLRQCDQEVELCGRCTVREVFGLDA